MPAKHERFWALLTEKKRREARRAQTGPGGLIEFVRYFWDVLEPVTPLVEGEVLWAMCEHLEGVASGEVRRLLMNVSPGFMKSLLTNVFFPAWLWSAFGRPDMRFVSFSYSAHLTERDNRKFLALIKSIKFQELWGGKFALTKEGSAEVANDSTGRKFASSVGGVGTGERGDIVFLDDPHNVKEAESQSVREETVRWFRESMQNRLNDLRTGAIVVIMQRVHESDVSGCILENYPEYVHFCVPMEYEPERHCETAIGWSDWRLEAGELAWPERFHREDLEPFRSLPFLWAGQYQQRPAPRGGGIISILSWEYWDKAAAAKYGRNENQFPDFDYIVMSGDTAFTEKKENDFCAWVVLGIWADLYRRPKVMVMTAGQERMKFNDLVEKFILLARKYKIDRMLIESKANGISVAQEVRRLQGDEKYAVQLVDPGNQDKIARAWSIQPLMGEQLEDGRRRDGIVYVPCITNEAGASYPRAWADLLMTTCASFPKGAHDDLVDAYVQGMRHLRDAGLARRSDEMIVEEQRAMVHIGAPPPPLYPV